MKASIVLDDWKLPIFKRHLEGAGFTYTRHSGVTEGTMTLTVETELLTKLSGVVKAANSEVAKSKFH